MTRQPLVSVLMPARDAARWIGDAIHSALAQTWPAIEVIVAESGSTDDTRTVVERLATSRVRLLPDKPAASAAANRNRAREAAQGDLFQFLDADDLLHPDKIRRQVDRLSGDGERVASAEWARFYTSPDDARLVAEPVWTDLDPVAWLIRAWTGGEPMMQPGLWLVPRDVAERAGPWDESLTLIDDFEYFTRVVLASRGVLFAAGSRLYYRSGNPDSLASVRSPAAWQSAWRALDLGTRALLSRTDTATARRACADLFQRLAFEAYIENEATAAHAEARAAALGGSHVAMEGGALFRGLRRVLGWKVAKRVKRSCYRLGYGRVARFKEARFAESRAR